MMPRYFLQTANPSRIVSLLLGYHRFRRWMLVLIAMGFSTRGQANPITWTSTQVRTWQASGGFSLVLAHLPDGRFVLGQQGKVFVQPTYGLATITEVAANGRTFDPSFIAIRSATSALLGAGGNFGAISGLHPFNPASPATGVSAAYANTVQNYVGVYWKSPTLALEGWLIGGANGPSGPFSGHNVIFVNLAGTLRGPVTQELSSYSAGLTVDAGGNLFTALYELEGTDDEAESDKVLHFSAAQIETAIQAVINGTPAPLPRSASTFVHKFDSASSIAVDGLGRVWSAGFKVEHVQVFEPSTGRLRTLVPAHAPITGATTRGYQVSTFTRTGTPYLGFLAYDLYGTTGTPVIIGNAPAADVTMPSGTTFATWRAAYFGAAALTIATELTVWGATADPDHDGLPNVTEYALNTQPLTPNALSPITTAKSGALLTFTFPRNPLVTDVTYTVEVSSTLAPDDWTPIATSIGGAATVATGASAVSEVTEGAMKRVTVTDQASATGAAKRLMRLRISAP